MRKITDKQLFTWALAWLFAISAASQGQVRSNTAQQGKARPHTYYVGTITSFAGIAIPVRVSLSNDREAPAGELLNGTERLPLTYLRSDKDTLVFTPAVFNAELKILRKGENLTGYLVNLDAAKRKPLAFAASPAPTMLQALAAPLQDSSRYIATFTERDGNKPYPAVFQLQRGQGAGRGWATGTFETETGDYRYLQGEWIGDSLWLSCFDGSHLYLFTGKKSEALVSARYIDGCKTSLDISYQGNFRSGSGGHQRWMATLSPTAHLSDPLTLSKPATTEPVDLTLTLPDGSPLHLSDPKYKGKALVLAVMGTWCPNCMDETAQLAKYYASDKRPKNLEILGLAFERKPERTYWAARLERVAKIQNVPYPLAYAGPARNDSASARLPFITGVKAFPTTIFLDRQHRVRYIHTGYAGPATGAKHQLWLAEFDLLVAACVKEN